ncbi:MAG: YihY/virulence factor BrkB family protein [Pirellulaceae bacterium]
MNQRASRRVTEACAAAAGQLDVVAQKLDGMLDETLPRPMTRWLRQLFPNVAAAARRWSEDDAGSMAAAVAYYLALSLFPLLLLLTAGMGLFLQFTRMGSDAEKYLLELAAMHMSEDVERQVRDVLVHLRNHSVITGPTGLLATIMAAIGVFAQLDRGMDRIWRIPPRRSTDLRGTASRVFRDRLGAFLMLVSLGGMVVGLFLFNTLWVQVQSVTSATLPHWTHLGSMGGVLNTYLATSLLFACAYRWLPRKSVGWLDAIRGGLLAALIWEMGRMVLEAVWIGMRYTTAYGAIGSFIALLLWCYYGVSIFFLGAEYVQVLQDHAKATEVNLVLPQQDKSPLSLSQKLQEEAPKGPAIDRRTIPRRSRPRATGGSMLRRVA